MVYWVNQYCSALKDQNMKISNRLQVSLEAEDLDSPVSAVAWSEDGEAFALGEGHHLVINITIINVSIIRILKRMKREQLHLVDYYHANC